MGHSVDMHKSVYRVQESTMEMTKVAGMLMAIEAGCVQTFSNRDWSSVKPAGKHTKFLWNILFNVFETY
jgi:hypothetical protein